MLDLLRLSFSHLQNSDNSVDFMRTRCFAPVGRNLREHTVEEAEDAHICQPGGLRWYRHSKGSQT